MKNLKTDYIDLYYLHRINRDIPIEDVALVMGKLIQEKQIRGWGLSQVTKETIQKAHELTPVTAVQNLYSLLERDCEDDVFPYCLDNQIGVVAFSPIASGLLSGKVTSETKFEGDDVRKFLPQLTQENIVKNQPIIDILHQFAKEKEATPAQISLAWMLHKYPNVVPIPGSKNKDRIIENLQASSITLSNEEFKKLEKALAQHQVFGHIGHNESENSDFSKKLKINKRY